MDPLTIALMVKKYFDAKGAQDWARTGNFAAAMNVAPSLNEPARWLQWAMTGAGDKSKEREARYNLDQFWKSKARIYPTATDADKKALERLDAMAHNVWAIIEGRAVWTSWTDAGAKEAADKAKEAYRRATEHAKAGDQPTWVKFSENNAKAVGQSERAAADMRPGVGSVLGADVAGLPIWAWALGAVALALILTTGPAVTVMEAIPARRKATA